MFESLIYSSKLINLNIPLSLVALENLINLSESIT